MFSKLEKHNKLCWAVTIIIAGAIFYISSISFEPGYAVGTSKSFLYHFLAFFFLAFFLLVSMIQGKKKQPSIFLLGICLALIYAISDELHQLFVPGRYFSFLDILINSTGVLSASVLYALSLKSKSNSQI